MKASRNFKDTVMQWKEHGLWKQAALSKLTSLCLTFSFLICKMRITVFALLQSYYEASV